MTLNIVQFCDDPPPKKKKKTKKKTQNLYTQKYSFFWKTQKILKFKILNKKNDLSLRMNENIRVSPLWLEALFCSIQLQ